MSDFSSIEPSFWRDAFDRDEFVGQILSLFLTAWGQLHGLHRTDKEVPITRKLLVELRKHKYNTLAHIPFTIFGEVETLDDDAELVGRHDLQFTYGFDERKYFVFECKRLCVPNDDGGYDGLGTPYVNEGMMRFINGQYAAPHGCGGMVGYVMNGKIDLAVDTIEASINYHVTRLRIKRSHSGTCLHESRHHPTIQQIKETLHDHSTGAGELLLHHIFLGVK